MEEEPYLIVVGAGPAGLMAAGMVAGGDREGDQACAEGGQGVGRRGQGDRGQRAAAWLCAAGQGRQGHPPRQAVVRYRDGGRMRGDHDRARRDEGDHQGAGIGGPAGVYGVEDSLVEKERAAELRPPGDGAAAA